MNKNKRNNPKKNIHYMKKPYNKIIFNYSFEKNSNDKNTKIKNQRKFFNKKGKINGPFIESYFSKDENNNYDDFLLSIYIKLNDISTNNEPISNGLSFSLSSMKNHSLPYEKRGQVVSQRKSWKKCQIVFIIWNTNF